MKNLARLIEKISLTKDPNSIIQLLVSFFNGLSSNEDKDTALRLLLGITPKRVISIRKLKISAAKLTGYPQWLVDRSETEAGSFIGALALLLRSKDESDNTPFSMWMKLIVGLQQSQEPDIHMFIIKYLPLLSFEVRLILLKLLTGTFKSVVSQDLVEKAMAGILEIAPPIATLRLYKLTCKNCVSYQGLHKKIENEENKIPMKFPETRILERKPENLGNPGKWRAFGKTEGIEAQLVKYRNSIILWSSASEILSEKFPEIINDAKSIKGNYTFHGQIIPKNRETTLDLLSSRLHKKKLSKNEISDFAATFEIWQQDGPNEYATIPQFPKLISIEFSDWAELDSKHQRCRKEGFTGILLQHQNELKQYLLYKAASFSVNAALTYLEFGGMSESGIKSITFGMQNKNEMVTIGKVDAPFEHIDCGEIAAFVKENTLERFGPVRTVKPQLVFELHFDGIAPAPRRKSGLMLINLSVHKKIPGNLEIVDSIEKLQKIG